MGMNYYIEFNICKHCGKPEKTYHIGKSSYGWVFSLHVDSYEGVNNLDDVKKLWDGQKIVDEDGDIISPEEMLKIITERKFDGRINHGAAFYLQNNAIPGPNNLARHSIGETHCIGHGPGTYDYIIREFS
jgi:hypothetical protein